MHTRYSRYSRPFVIFVIILLAFSVLIGTEIPVIMGTAGSIFVAGGSTYDINDDTEVYYWEKLTHEIASMAQEAGYIAKDIYGSQSTKSAILNVAREAYIFLYFGHGAFNWVIDGCHYFFHDNDGKEVFDYEIYPESTYYFTTYGYSERVIFLWSCFQAGGVGDLENRVIGDMGGKLPYGMPYAWLHTPDPYLSTDGYKNPYGDYGKVFIGFLRYAPYITYSYTPFKSDHYNPPLYWFIKLFFWSLFIQWRLLDPSGMSINEALDFASEKVWGVPFNLSPLYRGYLLPELREGKMVVYGRGDYILINQRWKPPAPPGPEPLKILSKREEIKWGV